MSAEPAFEEVAAGGDAGGAGVMRICDAECITRCYAEIVTISLRNLPPEIEAAIKETSQREGISPGAFAIRQTQRDGLCGTHAPAGQNELLGRADTDQPRQRGQNGRTERCRSLTASSGAVLSIDEVAQAAGTVGYELMCALAQRVPVVAD